MFSAIERLRQLRAGKAPVNTSDGGSIAHIVNHPGGPCVADLPTDWRLEWEERAAIREFEGGQVREHAEAEALREIIERMRVAGMRIEEGGYQC